VYGSLLLCLLYLRVRLVSWCCLGGIQAPFGAGAAANGGSLHAHAAGSPVRSQPHRGVYYISSDLRT
jgi:hypothetical protein